MNTDMKRLSDVDMISPLVPFLIEYHRIKKLLSHAEVSDATGISIKTIRMIEQSYYVPTRTEWESLVNLLDTPQGNSDD